MRMTQAEYMDYLVRTQAKREGVTVSLPKDTPERVIQDEIEAYLKSLGSTCWYVRARMDIPTTVRKGVVDFNGWYRGKPFAMEVKRPGQKPTPEQQGELRWCELAGAKTIIAHSLQEVIDFFAEL